MPEEVVDALEAIAPLTEVKSTLFGSSFLTLKERGHAAQYLTKLPSELHEVIQFTPAGVWLPASTAIAHYKACDALGLSSDEVYAMGDAVARITKPTMQGFAAAAAGAGVTPWTVFRTTNRFWARVHRGSGVRIVKLGPKEGRFEVLGMPLAAIPYWRIALRGIIHGMVAPFCSSVYVRELGSGADMVTYRVQWA